MNKKLTELKDLWQINDFIPPAQPLFQTLPTLIKADNNIKNKCKVDKSALPTNLMDEIKRGVELKPVISVAKVIEKAKIDENDLGRMNPLDIAMFRLANMMSSRSNSDSSSENSSQDEWNYPIKINRKEKH
ncbi:uncharacterized protein LOC126909664 [Daktulosphaira vitifoliae]|uniref:uncharacterized protein LOC126907437 n=1 Tax=Daktulosphaira vitifoliae TaxID=58002 RepID=UPI0021AA0694|nr:uncharacterized protein LOC126907437 [Daktulosphaira vitifoliae]XP_050548060.1 uncharacterized protein LOC126909664 [Daktulosphaira vitifoliae]XP_050548061.1 uncharacterized protein LOC126909664 [Daktulosphaira vitifoliae]